KAESIEWSHEGVNIQGWLVPPAKVEPSKKYPMVMLIHGGPSSITTSEWPASFGMSRAIITCSFQIPVEATARVKISRVQTCKILGAATCATISPESMQR